jgi:hypothetical protein
MPTAEVMVDAIIVPPSGISHSTMPLSTSKARKRRLRSPQNRRSPAVVSAEPLPDEWTGTVAALMRFLHTRFREDVVWNGAVSAQQHFVLQCARDT